MKLNQVGLTLIDVVLMLSLLSIGMAVVLSYVGFTSKRNSLMVAASTRDRIWTGVRMMAGMPAAIRNSARASSPDGTQPVNLELRNCINGVQKNQCVSGLESGFALYSPVLNLDEDGKPIGIQQVTAALGESALRVDTAGFPCTKDSPGCIFLLSSSFKPHCAPENLPAVLPANLLNPNVFAGTLTCTVADFIEIKFFIEVAKDAPAESAELAAAVAGKTGSIFLSVKDISGNDPQ